MTCKGCDKEKDNDVLPVCISCWNEKRIPEEFIATAEEAATTLELIARGGLK